MAWERQEKSGLGVSTRAGGGGGPGHKGRAPVPISQLTDQLGYRMPRPAAAPRTIPTGEQAARRVGLLGRARAAATPGTPDRPVGGFASGR